MPGNPIMILFLTKNLFGIQICSVKNHLLKVLLALSPQKWLIKHLTKMKAGNAAGPPGIEMIKAAGEKMVDPLQHNH